MGLRFWILCALYHLIVGAAVFLRARRWLRCDLARQRVLSFTSSLFRDCVLCGTTSALWACFLALHIRDRHFAMIRFLSQTLFGEALLFLPFLAFLQWRRGSLARSAVLALAALALLTVYVDAYHVEPYRLQIERHELSLHGHAPIERTRAIRLLHLSDIQASRIGDHERRVVRQAARLAPDIVVMTGDYVQERYRRTGARTAHELSDLIRREGPRPPLGTYAVGGDTDDFGIERLFTGIGIRWLNDESVTLDLRGTGSLTIIGLAQTTSWGARPEALRRLVSEAPQRSIRIVIGHAPDYVMRLRGGPRVDLALAGHTHGGQIVIPFFGPPLTLSRLPRHIAAGGLHDEGGVALYVSRGIGMERGSAPQIRFLCPPEISVLTLRY